MEQDQIQAPDKGTQWNESLFAKFSKTFESTLFVFSGHKDLQTQPMVIEKIAFQEKNKGEFQKIEQDTIISRICAQVSSAQLLGFKAPLQRE